MINMIHIGLGSWGPNVARNFQWAKNCRLALLCNLRRDRK